MREKLRSPGKRVCTVHCGSFKMHCMLASSTPCKLSLCADRAHACAGDSYTSSGIDVASPTTQSVLAIASLHELHGDSWPSSSTGTSSFCCNQQYSITAVTTSAGAIAERYAYSAYGEPTICDPSGSTLSSSAINNRYTHTGREWDATVALYHFRARWMSPKTGRFLGRDPIGFLGARFSVVEYVRSNPERFGDPSGLRDNTVPGGQLPRDDRNDGNVFCTWIEMEGFNCRRNGYPRDSFPCHQSNTGCFGITAGLIGHYPTFTNGDFQCCFDKLDQAQKKQSSLSGSGYCKGKDCNGKGSDPVIFGFTWNRNNGSLVPSEKPMQFCPVCGFGKWNDERPQRCWIWDFGFHLEGPNVFCHANEGQSR